MALYHPAASWSNASEICKIPLTEHKDGVTVYVIEVHVSPFTWHVSHRYSDFHELHEKLILSHHVNKNLLPPKKIFGTQSESFILKRQSDLELYLQTLVHQFSYLPPTFASFLDFHKYEVRTITENLSEMLFHQGDLILLSKQEFQFSPLELHSITERLKLAEPTCPSGNKKRDLGHLLSFISQLKKLKICGSYENVGSSNIIPNDLKFDLSPFKSLESLEVHCCKIRDRLQTAELLRNTLKSLVIHKSIKDMSSIFLCGVVHWSPRDCISQWPYWSFITTLNLSHNFFTAIDPSIRLMSAVETIDLSYNNIQDIENLESLPRLAVLNISYNKLCHLNALHTRLGNIKVLQLGGNTIECLQGLSRLFSLAELYLNDNHIVSMAEISCISSLPCLEKLNLRNNPITAAVDYRSHVLLAFGSRASELVLDGERASEKELDTVAVLQALQVARIEKSAHQNLQTIFTSDKNVTCSSAHPDISCTSNIPKEFGTDQTLYQNSVNR